LRRKKVPTSVGFVFFPKSPRFVELEEARVLAAIARGKIRSVAVMVDPNDELVDGVAERVRPDLLQLHGKETPERVAAIKERTGRPVMKAISISEAGDARDAARYAGIADYLLFDAKGRRRRAFPGAMAFRSTGGCLSG
jgi:phosphoribosylanthranilate isomerase